jgi:hypothetical protein
VEDTANVKARTRQKSDSLEVTVPNPEPLSQLMLLAVARLFPEGGQRTARRNAWAAMSSNATLARDRREADAAIAAAMSRLEPGFTPSAPRKASTV